MKVLCTVTFEKEYEFDSPSTHLCGPASYVCGLEAYEKMLANLAHAAEDFVGEATKAIVFNIYDEESEIDVTIENGLAFSDDIPVLTEEDEQIWDEAEHAITTRRAILRTVKDGDHS